MRVRSQNCLDPMRVGSQKCLDPMRVGSPRNKTLVGMCRCSADASSARAKVRALIEGIGIFLSEAELHAFFTVKPASRPAARLATGSPPRDRQRAS